MTITTTGSTATVSLATGTYLLAAGTGGLDGTGSSLATTVAANATLSIGVANEATATSITFTTLTAALGATVNVIGGADTVAALTSAGGAINVSNGGSLTVNDLSGVSAATQLNIGAGSTLVLGPTVNLSALELINFTGSTGNLVLNALGLNVNLATAISGFTAGDTLAVTGVNYNAGASSYNPVTNTLSLVTTTGATQTFSLAGTAGNASLANQYFHINDTAGGATVFVNADPTNGFAACYAKGTRVLAARGTVPVEDLQIGDELVTAAGNVRPLRWIGHRSYAGRFLAGNPALQPVVIRAGALGNGVPHRDLLVSQQHAMLLDGVLIPAHCLVNGRSIAISPQAEVHYFHLELESHDVILAEGAPSESFVDDDSRGVFHNAASFATLYPETLSAPARYCAPRVEDGFQLEAVRARLMPTPANAQDRIVPNPIKIAV